MSHRPSIPSAKFSAPTTGNGHAILRTPEKRDIEPFRHPPNVKPTSSWEKASTLDNVQSVGDDPDELFTRHTISEVKFIQQRLRADADAKQEELRLMVGERYRDLLQASTSIITIARSSERVKQALEDTKNAILSQKESPLPRKSSISGSNDIQLYNLQLLSAHMKLLLDAPEHLWRLIERKKFYPAAWLLLLAGVVHRVLVRDDDDDDDDQEDRAWRNQGIIVLEQFPLVQRQWDAISQFRSQIIHKASISLRDNGVTVEDTCATLLTLHLLDSRPLTETFSLFLGQRTKTLQALVSWDYRADVSKISDKRPTGNLLELEANSSGFRRKPVNVIREATHAALKVIFQTCKTARGIFHDDLPHASLIRRALEAIQSDFPIALQESLPPSLCLTTQTLLTTLPSSAHLLLLPQSLRSYKPYVDLDSPSSSIQRTQFSRRMKEWFHHSSIVLHKAVEKWFSNLESIKEVWSIRASIGSWVSSSSLEREEMIHLDHALDELYQQRAIQIWRQNLSVVLKSFQRNLYLATSEPEMRLESTPESTLAEFLFRAPPLPLSHGSTRSTDILFQKYKTALRRQIVGRTTLLDELLSILERCASAIQQDLSHIKSGGDDTQAIAHQLTDTYRPEADTFCASIVQRLETTCRDLQDANQLHGLVLLSRIAIELSSSCPFISEIGCSPSTVTDFRTETCALHNRIICHWQEHTISRIIKDHRLVAHSRRFSTQMLHSGPGPSAHLVQSLLSLSRSIEQLGLFRNPSRNAQVSQESLHRFITEFTEDEQEDDTQTINDLAFLWKLSELQGAEWSDICQILDGRIERKLQPGINSTDLKKMTSDSLMRTQLLFTTFLPNKPLPQPLPPASADRFSSLLPFGVPNSEQQFESGIDLAKPSSRFGLLLVGGV